MRHLLKHIFILVLLFGCSKAEDTDASEWKKLVSNTSQSLTDIQFLDNNFGLTCGSFGTLLKTENAGDSWQDIDVGINHSFMSLFILTQNEFFVAKLGLYKTDNSGVDFNELGNTSSFGATITGIHFYNSQVGIICKGSNIYKTYDGGVNWVNTFNEPSYASLLEATENNTLYLAGGRTYDNISEGEIHKSIDNGDNWEQLNLPLEIENSQITAIDFLDNNIGFISTFEKKIFETLDGGASWVKISDFNIGIISDLLFIDNNNGYLISTDKIYKTINGGLNWKVENVPGSSSYLNSIEMAPNGDKYIVGNDGVILKKN